MLVSDYLAELQATKTYQDGLIKTQEYAFKSSFGGLIRSLPNIPYGDADRQIIVMELRGNQPNIFAVLKDNRYTVNLTARDADKLLFIFVEMKPRTLEIAAPQEGYQLGDGHKINAAFTLTYHVADAEEFWRGARDPLAQLEKAVVNEAKNYFLRITSNYLVSNPADLKKTLEQHLQETEIKIVKDNLEENILEKSVIAGIAIEKVYADVHLSKELSDHLKRVHASIYEPGGILDKRRSQEIISDHRRGIDKLIDQDITFAPYKLKDVVMMLDTALLENFYTMEWSDAMRKVHEKLTETKKDYLEKMENAEITKMKKLIHTAQELGLDSMQVQDLKDKLAEKLLKSADNDTGLQLPSDNEFLQLRLNASAQSKQITSGVENQT